MKKNFKKRILTGIAAIALVAPLMLSGAGMNHAHAATQTAPQITTGTNSSTTSTSNQANSNNSGQSSNSSQLAAIKAQIQAQYNSLQTIAQPYRQKYQKLPKNDKSQQNALEAQFEKQAKPVQEKITSLQKEYTNTMTPEQRKQAQQKQQAAQKQMMQQIQKQMKAQQEKEKAQMLKTAQSLFLVQGNKVYTVKADINKKGSATPVPGTMKKYTSLKRFARIQRQAITKAQLLYQRARRSRNSKFRKNEAAKAQSLYMKYGRVGQIPTKKQQQAQAKEAAKAQKANKSRKNVKKNRVNNKRTKRTRRNRKRGRKSVRKNRRKIRNRIKRSNSKRSVRHVKKVRRSSNSFNVKEFGHQVTLLRSEFKRGNYRAAKRSGFVQGKDFSDGLNTMFDRYRPNSRRAVIPKNYKIYKVNVNDKNRNQRATVWLVGRRNNNIAKMKQAYYYGYNNSKHYGGWRNIGA